MEILPLIGIEEKKAPMEKYMKNKFPFLGIPAPDRKNQTKALIKESKCISVRELLQWIEAYYQQEAREFQYIAIDLALANIKSLSLDDVKSLALYIERKAWWDSVDAWRKVFAARIEAFPEELEEIFYWFYQHENFWVRRVGINLQLKQKERTDVALLTKAIIYDRNTDEFFIQKAIGWSLREYSKTNPSWVENFLKANELSSLAVREGSKHL